MRLRRSRLAAALLVLPLTGFLVVPACRRGAPGNEGVLAPDPEVAARVRSLRSDLAPPDPASFAPIEPPEGVPWTGELELQGPCRFRVEARLADGRTERMDEACSCAIDRDKVSVACDTGVVRGRFRGGRVLLEPAAPTGFRFPGQATGPRRLAGRVEPARDPGSSSTPGIVSGSWELLAGEDRSFRNPPETGPPARLVDLSDLSPEDLCPEDGVVVLHFWSTWCGPCLEEMPLLEAFHRRHHDDGIRLLAVEVGSDADLVRRRVERLGVTFPVVLDRHGSLARQWGVNRYPTTLLLADGCRLRETFVGFGQEVEGEARRQLARARATAP